MTVALIVRARLALCLTSALLLLGSASLQAALIHRWSFNEGGTNLTVLDSVGTAHGTVVVMNNPDYSRGTNYLRLGGNTWNFGDYVAMPSGMISSLTNVTIEIWAAPNAIQNWSRIFDFGPAAGNGAANDFYLSFCRGTSLQQQRLEHDPTPYFRIDTSLATTTSNRYHYVVTWSKTGGPSGGGLAAWYRDGVLIGSVDTGTRSVTNVDDTTMWLGRSHFTSDNTASADYHEVRIYTHAMSSNEVVFNTANGPDVYITPPNQASGLSIATNANSTLTLSWTPGAGSAGSVVVMSAGQANSMQPNYRTNYAASASFGSGANLGSSNFVVFTSAGSSVTVSNLSPGLTYFATAYAYAGTGTNTVFNLADAPSVSQLLAGTVQSLALTTPTQLAFGASAQATVQATFVGGATANVTSNATYSSSASNIVSVTTNGLLTGVGYGSANIIATFSGKSATNSVTVINPLATSLKHRYPFTTDANDVVGTAHGTLQGGSAIANNMLTLDGTSGYVSLPTGIVATYTNVTFEAWVSNTVSAQWSRIFDFGSSTTVNMFLTPLGGSGVIRFALTTTGNGTGAEQQINGTAALPLSVMKHVALTINGGVGILYVDGVPVGTNSGMTLNPASMGATTQNYLGKSQYPDPYFSGAIDEFRIYDSALPASLVLTNFLNGPNGLAAAPPTTVDDSVTLNPGAKVLIPVLANDTGTPPIASTVEVVTAPANGTAVAQPNGKILYSHNGSATTFDAFTYRVQNYLGNTSATAIVSITITNGLKIAATTMAMPPTPPATGYQIVNAFPGLNFEDAVVITTPPGRTNQIFVAERRGIISYVPDINAANPVRNVFLNITNMVQFDDAVEGEMGLLGVAFHPNFQSNGYFFVAYEAPGSPYTNRLARFQADPVTLAVNTNTQVVLFDVLDQDFNHNGSDLHFGPTDGYLYMCMGDEGSQYNARQNAQRIDKDLFSAILRIDVDKKPGNVEPRPSANTTRIPTTNGLAYYSIPANNPFVNATNYLGSITNAGGTLFNTNTLRAEIFATGLRHVWRFSIDTNGEVWVGDVGQDRYEEVNIITNGGNYGWAYYEGVTDTFTSYPTQTGTLLSLASAPPGFAAAYRPPLYYYNHTALTGDAQFKGNSISGGVVYRGNRIPELNGAYVFGDFVSGNVWALWRSNNTVIATNRIGGMAGVSAYGLDPGNGDVLLANYAQNQIQRLIKVEANNDSFPQKLSDTGAFADLTTLSPNPGMLNYDPIVAFWSDNAIKRRWFAQTDLSSNITHVTDGNWVLPPAMVWVKHFDFEMIRGNPATKKRLETRFIVKSTNGVYGVSYAWDPAGTEAYLVPDGGTNFSLTYTDGVSTVTQAWGIPSRSDCIVCHVEVAGRALSFNTRQLNQTSTINGITGNQLKTLSDAGYFVNPVTAPQTLPAFAHATNSAASLEYRTRSYLAVNCAQCHQPGGSGSSTWDARAWLSLGDTHLINGIPYNDGANPSNKLVVPGDVAHSIVLQRIRGNGFSRMPPLATTVIDAVNTNLLTAWISGELTNRQSFADWQLAYFGSTNAANALASSDPDGDGANNYYEYLTKSSPLTNAPAPWTVAINKSASTVTVSFQRIANLGFVVETSPDNLSNWAPWDVTGNTLWFSASNFTDSVSGPWDGMNRFHRVKIVEP
ncbi:MAG: hypothetical protein RLY20_453 [Verrucomicrobiota bacterium]|jgi:glucose/arabinose dehydrogenase/mono/diheme cytochrome c family protein